MTLQPSVISDLVGYRGRSGWV